MIETPFSTRSRRGEAGRSLNLCKQPRPWDAPRARDLLKVAKKLPNHRVLNYAPGWKPLCFLFFIFLNRIEMVITQLQGQPCPRSTMRTSPLKMGDAHCRVAPLTRGGRAGAVRGGTASSHSTERIFHMLPDQLYVS